MTDKVVDASAMAALLFNEPEAEAVATRLDGARLFAPSLIALELANTCVMKSRRDPESRDLLVAAFRQWRRLAIEKIVVDDGAVLDLAFATGLTAYDASYLWLARLMNIELVTLDKALVRAMRP